MMKSRFGKFGEIVHATGVSSVTVCQPVPVPVPVVPWYGRSTAVTVVLVRIVLVSIDSSFALIRLSSQLTYSIQACGALQRTHTYAIR